LKFRLGNLRGELFSSTFTYGLSACIKLGSSLILTRLLSPESYGIFGILLSFLFMIELMSDVGTTALLIRHERGRERHFVHAVWTIRLCRCVLNFCIVFFGAPLIADIYQAPVLTNAFRVLSFGFLLTGAESMSFILAQRDQRSRISNYADLLTNLIMTLCVIYLAIVLKDAYALIYGSLLQRALMMAASHLFYREVGIGFAYDREAFVDQFRFARFVLPSSLLTIVLTQYDKVVLLKLFSLSTLGIYGLAGNMLGPVNGVNMHNARVVLYARCAEYFRSDRTTARQRYYAENSRLLTLGVALPALLAGAAQPLVDFLYDSRYALAGKALMVLALTAVLSAFQNASENLIVAYGRTHIVLVANLIRLFTVIPATLLGYYLFGFDGFLWFTLLGTLPLTGYFLWEQHKYHLLDPASELRRLLLAGALFIASLVASRAVTLLLPPGWRHLSIHSH
jgi:O-antigen/teichoic acid export membrane protein